MVNQQCGCSLSIIKDKCEREGLECYRCLTRMKNSGNVWGVNVGVLVANNYPLTGIITDWPSLEIPLFYDIDLRANPDPDDTPSCFSAVAALRKLSGETTYNKGFVSPSGDDQILRITLFYSDVWRLDLEWSIYASAITDPSDDFGDESYLRARGRARYKSQLSVCGSLNGSEMELIDSTYSELQGGNGVPSQNGPDPWPVSQTIFFKLIPNPNL